MTGWRRLAIAFASIGSMVVVTDFALAEAVAFTDQQLAEARTFIETKMDPVRRAQLMAMALKSGQTPEHMFLTNSFWRTIGSGSGDVSIPAKGSDKSNPQGQAESGDVDFLPKGPKKN